MKRQLKVKKTISTPYGKKLEGTIIALECTNGIPTDRFWRARLKDSAIDNCVELLTTKKKK